VVEDYGTHAIGALEVGEKKGPVFGDGFGHGLHLAHLEDLVGHVGGGGRTVIDDRGNDPKPCKEQDKEGNSAENGY
jgi:hypothetical protein